jgi:hypothetical protein
VHEQCRQMATFSRGTRRRLKPTRPAHKPLAGLANPRLNSKQLGLSLADHGLVLVWY